MGTSGFGLLCPPFSPLFSTQLPARLFEKINLIRSLCGSKSSLSASVLKMTYKDAFPTIISLILFPVLSTSHSIIATLDSLFLDCIITSEPLHKPLHRCNLPHRHSPQEALSKDHLLKNYNPILSPHISLPNSPSSSLFFLFPITINIF